MSKKTPQEEVDSVLSKIREICAKGGNYIFRGEAKDYGKVSSTLYRTYKNVLKDEGEVDQNKGHSLTMDDIKQQTITNAKQYTTEKDDDAIWELIQHYGGGTNLIDFSYDYAIALFFACDGHRNDNGRLILYDKSSIDDVKVKHIEPSEPRGRVIAQKSIFISPKNGVLDVEEENIIPILAQSKRPILNFLRTYHGITAHAIYNDIHGYISRHQPHKEDDAHPYRGHNMTTRGISQMRA